MTDNGKNGYDQTAEGRAAFRAPKLGASRWYNNAATSAINAAQNAYNQ